MFLVLAFAAIALGAAAAPRSAFGGLEYRTVIIWLSVPLILTLASQQFFIILVFLLLLIFAAPASALDRVKLFALIVPAAPLYLHTVISLPGISYFLSLDFYKCAVLVLLIPAIFLKLKERDDVAPWSIVDICVILYTVYTSFQLMMSLGVIGGARSMVSQVLVYTLPYFAIRWVVSNEKDVRPVFAGFVVAACMLAFIALISAWKQWDFYRMARFDELGGFVELRDGRLRIQATLNTHSLGYTLLLGLFLLQYAKSYISIGFLRLWGLRGLLLLAAFAPASKGALAGFALGCVVYVVLSIRSSALRWVLGLCVSIGGGIIGYQLMFGDVAKFDDHGSIGYRQELIAASIDFISDHLLFGDLQFLQSGRFDHLMQGQGIIDITNLYLQLLLGYGMVGGLLFFGPIFLVLVHLALRTMYLSKSIEPDQSEMRHACIAICSGIVGWLFLIATTSDVGLTFHLGVFLLALGEGIRLRRQDRTARSEIPARFQNANFAT